VKRAYSQIISEFAATYKLEIVPKLRDVMMEMIKAPAGTTAV
jgi:hypothetical protein